MNIFEKASKKKLRFATAKGGVSVEDLWDVPMATLNVIALALDKSLSETANKSFIEDSPTVNSDDQLRFDVVKSIITTRRANKDAASKSAATKAQNARILEILARKEDAALNDMDPDDLRKLLVQTED